MKTKDPLKKKLWAMGERARQTAQVLACLSTEKKNDALVAMAQSLRKNSGVILKANARDVRAARAKGLNEAMIDRLTLTEKRVDEMAQGLEEMARLDDPVGKVISTRERPNGLVINKIRIPIGVILMIYESRPNVTSDCVGLCLKSGNVCVLRGGSEAFHSNSVLCEVMAGVLRRLDLPSEFINFIQTPDRRAVDILLAMDEWIDLVMPRGGESLIREVRRKSRIPVIKHYKGVCHVYIDQTADFDMARRIIVNAKVQRPGVCNAAECLLVHEGIAGEFLPLIIKDLTDRGVEMRADHKALRIVPTAKRAVATDWGKEFLSLIMAVRVVADIDEAIGYINTYGSHHSDAIVTTDQSSADKFLREVDSACVYVNASTRFTDGGQFGLGAEIGISTDRLHARGPMGLEELTTYKYVIRGTGQIRD